MPEAHRRGFRRRERERGGGPRGTRAQGPRSKAFPAWSTVPMTPDPGATREGRSRSTRGRRHCQFARVYGGPEMARRRRSPQKVQACLFQGPDAETNLRPGVLRSRKPQVTPLFQGRSGGAISQIFEPRGTTGEMGNQPAGVLNRHAIKTARRLLWQGPPLPAPPPRGHQPIALLTPSG